MRRYVRPIAISAAIAIWLVPASAASAEDASQTVQGGSLSVTPTSVSFNGVTLNGSNQTSSKTTADWSIVDPRGTGAAWTVSVRASGALTSAAGTVETTARTIALGNLSVSTGSFTAATGSDAATGITGASSMVLTTGDQTLASTSGPHKGTYTFAPTFALAVPANAYRSNYATGTSGAMNPYTTTLTITVA